MKQPHQLLNLVRASQRIAISMLNKTSEIFLGGATQKIRQSVKNSSQRKREFLRQIQEEENITRNSLSQNYEEKPASSYDELEGQVNVIDLKYKQFIKNKQHILKKLLKNLTD